MLADPGGELPALREQTRRYPAALGDALVAGLWEADFAADLARYGAARADPVYAVGCLFPAVGVACQALHGHARRWLINEKGMVAATGRLPAAPPRFAERAQALLGTVGAEPAAIGATVSAVESLLAEVRAAVQAAG